MTLGELLIDAPANKIEARNLRRQLLVWRERQAEQRKRFERIERAYVRRFGRAGLASASLPLPMRLAALEDALENRLR